MTMRACAWVSAWLPQYILSCSVKRGSSCGCWLLRQQVCVNTQRFHPSTSLGGMPRFYSKGIELAPETLVVGLIGRFDPRKPIWFCKCGDSVKSGYTIGTLLWLAQESIGVMTLGSSYKEGWLADRFHLLGRREDILD